MGRDGSLLGAPCGPPSKLSERSLRAVAEYIRSGRARRIVVMTGAGISTAAGIPDFRSPTTGLYANLSRLNLPHAEAVFDMSYFRQNPHPFYALAQEIYPGAFHPTISHAFLALLARKNLLAQVFTQNIDTLERRAGVCADLLVEAHGSFASQRCIECRKEYPDEPMREHIAEGKVPRCVDQDCGGLVKPDIVFFGEALPAKFGEAAKKYKDEVDLVLVLGTSLSVYPFAGLPEMVAEGVPRVLFNREPVGRVGTRADDVIVLGDCDEGVRTLASHLEWRSELEELWRVLVGEEEARKQETRRKGAEEDGRCGGGEEESDVYWEELVHKLLVSSLDDVDDKPGHSTGAEKAKRPKLERASLEDAPTSPMFAATISTADANSKAAASAPPELPNNLEDAAKRYQELAETPAANTTCLEPPPRPKRDATTARSSEDTKPPSSPQQDI